MSNIDFTLQHVDAAYVNALVDLVNACRKNRVHIKNVSHFQHGWLVTFLGYDGDAICHNGSYGSPCYGGIYDPDIERNDWGETGEWETIGFPWDRGDVSVHSAESLAKMIDALDRDEDWEKWEKWEEN